MFSMIQINSTGVERDSENIVRLSIYTCFSAIAILSLGYIS